MWTVEDGLYCFSAKCRNIAQNVAATINQHEIKSPFIVLLFDCFVYRQSVTCLKRFTRYGHYEDEVS